MSSIPTDQEAWFFYESASGSYYTSTIPSKKEYHVAGDGNSFPTPNELKAKLDELGEDASVDESGLVYIWNEVDVKRKPVALPPGCYQHMSSSPSGSTPERLIPFEMRNDHYIKMESIYNPLAEDVKAFLENEAVYRKIGTIYKRGLLLYGLPGEGKTSIIRVLVKNEIPKDSVVIFFEFMPTTDLVNAMKRSLSERLKVFVFEELANLLEHSKMERVLDFLDGEKSIDRTLMIATTNYPERLPGNIIERPSRFDKMYKMGHPKAKERKLILGHYLMREALDEEVKATEGLSTAALKEISLLTHLRKLSVMEAAKLMKDHSALVKKDFSETKSMGFSNRHDDDDF